MKHLCLMEIFSKKYTMKQQVKMKIYLLVSFYYVFTTIDAQDSSNKRRKIGAIFDRKSEHLAKTFEFEVRRLSNSDKDIHLEQTHEIVECQDSFHVSNAICNLLEHNVYGILGAFQSCALSTIQSYTDTFKVPFISLSMPQQSSSPDPYQLYIRPAYIKGLLDVVQLKQWNKIFYIYETDDGLVRLQQLYQDINFREIDLDIIVKRIVSVQSCHQMLRDIYNEITKEPLRVFLDLTSDQSQEVITAIKHDPDISNNRFHFLLVDLGINDMNATVLSAGMNVSGFSLKVPEAESWNTQPRKKKTYGDVLVEDAVMVFHRALKKLTDPVTQIRNPDEMIKCRDNERSISFRPGKRVLNAIREGEYDGKSDSENPIKFQENGWRKEFKLPLFETRMNMQIAKVGVFNPPTQLQLHEPEIQLPPRPNITNRQIVRRITTVKEDPYVMWTEQGEQIGATCGRENFQGYIIDLIDKVSDYLKFNYTLCIAGDGTYGKKLENGTWNGVIGELTRGIADIAFAAMTISSERERVVDFTKPFMSLGISIMIKKPTNKKAHTFSFMDPLSYEIWMCILFAYVGVSVVLFLVSRFSPTEWHIEDDRTIRNDFTISNSLWYSLGAFMQQGCDISPKSVSGRIVGSVWWFFTLIIISSYTANLAAFLTVERMNTPIESAEDLAKQTQIQYGVYEYGTTADFFRLSKVAIYERMWAYMTSAQDVFAKTTSEGVQRVRDENGKYAYLIESSTNEYKNTRKPCDTMKVGNNLDSKGYGIATPIGSDLRDSLTLAVLHLREKGVLQSLKKKWWDERSECGKPSAALDGSEAELKLNNVAGIFYILIGGLSLSVIIAGFEFLYRSIVDSRKSEQGFGTIVRNKARLSFRGSMDSGNPESTTPLKKSGSSGTYTYTGPTQLPGFDPYVDTNTHTQV
ncbi:glutamate receptor-like [Mytilus galloprovincialis]|uniref:glutamate receptor-like n=1 Tax=Mytilus galloprovincialis TaxID=29158 RepID=UPI003F7B4836